MISTLFFSLSTVHIQVFLIHEDNDDLVIVDCNILSSRITVTLISLVVVGTPT